MSGKKPILIKRKIIYLDNEKKIHIFEYNLNLEISGILLSKQSSRLPGARTEGDADGNYGESNIIHIVIPNRALRMERRGRKQSLVVFASIVV
jgi:hypothetical protein